METFSTIICNYSFILVAINTPYDVGINIKQYFVDSFYNNKIIIFDTLLSCVSKHDENRFIGFRIENGRVKSDTKTIIKYLLPNEIEKSNDHFKKMPQKIIRYSLLIDDEIGK